MEAPAGEHAAAESATPNLDESAAAIDAAALQQSWRNASELCAAVLQCFERDDIDSQEKAVQALEQLVAADLLRPALRPTVSSTTCTFDAVRGALRHYRDRCELAQTRKAAAADAADADGEDGDGDAGTGLCDELLPTAVAIEHDLRALQEAWR